MAGGVRSHVELQSDDRRQWWQRFDLPRDNPGEASLRRCKNIGRLQDLAWAIQTMQRVAENGIQTAYLGKIIHWVKQEWRCGELPEDNARARCLWAEKVCDA